MKIRNLFVFVLISPFFTIVPANADQCFSQYQDSEWSNAEPNTLNMAGIDRKLTLDWPNNGFDNLATYDKIPLKFKFEYLGTNCSRRIINVDYVVNKEIYKKTLEEFISNYRQSASDLFNLDSRVENLRKIEFAAKSSRIILNAKVGESGTLDWGTWRISPLNSLIITVLTEGFPSTNNSLSSAIAISLDGKCLSADKVYGKSTYAMYKTHAILGAPTFNAIEESPAPLTLKISKPSCSVKLSMLLFGNPSSWGSSLEPNSPFSVFNMIDKRLIEVDLGTLIVESKSPSLKPTTITCIKGKLTKKVTAVNPKCPKGYVKKK